MVDPKDPFAAPIASLELTGPPTAPTNPRSFRAPILLGVSVGLLLLGVLASFTPSRFPSVALFGAAMLTAVVGAASGVRSLRRAPQGGRGWRLATTFSILGNLAMTAFGALAAFIALAGFSRGRQLRRLGRVLLPPVRAGDAWSRSPVEVVVPVEARAGLAAHWRENGRTEHASVAAFARLTLDLMALGAPPELIASANQDALDEIRHTLHCFSLARALDGSNESPAPFPAAQRVRPLPRIRTLALAQLAVDSLIDGALHEGVSARVIAKLARRCDEPAIRAVLKELAADEGRHCKHGWDVVEWCLTEGGVAVASALNGAANVLSRPAGARPSAARNKAPFDGSWEPWGIHGHALEAAEHQAAREEIILRVQKMTALPRSSAV